jgi:cytochrome c5
MPLHRRPLASLRAHPVLAVACLLTLAACGPSTSVDPEKTATLIQPVARVELKLEKIEPGTRTGAQVYQTICTSCHAAGALGAPKTGDAGQWAPRLAKGNEALVASVMNGLGAMPAKGGGSDLTDKEVIRAVAYLVNGAGGSMVEPPVE